MEYLTEEPKRWSPPKREKPQAERDLEWQNEGHKPITEDFSGDITPQERQDSGIV